MRPSFPLRTELAAALLLLAAAGSAAAASKPPPPDPVAEYARAMALYKDGDYARALAVYESVYAAKPLPEALYGIGRCHHQLAHWRDATVAYEKFLAAAPTHSSAPKAREYLVAVLTVLADDELKRGAFEPARADYARAVELRAVAYPAATDVESGRLLVGLGSAQAGAGDPAAVATLKKSLRAALPTEVRSRAESIIADLEAGRPPAALGGGAPASRPAGPDLVTPETAEHVDDPVLPAHSGGSKAPLFIAIGGGALVVAGVTIVLVLLLTRGEALPPHEFAIDWRSN
jgi:tetratricopeptide (TPR) repeat protein